MRHIAWALIAAPTVLVAQAEPVSESALPPAVESQSLSAVNIGAAGLLGTATTGLPDTIWRTSDARALATLVAAVDLPVPAMTRLMQTLLLAEAQPPASDRQLDFLSARLEWLVAQGALEEALALLEITGVEDPRLFGTWVDLSMLLGETEPVCRALDQQPSLTDNLSLRVFCTARSGDWQRAALILNTGQALGDITARRAELLTRFLDPELADDTALLPPVRPTPLEFRLFEALGEPLPTAPLPLPFAVLDLGGDNGWRAQIEAAERLARADSLPANRLLGLYTLRSPAASGGIWDRVAALQDFETALLTGSSDAASQALGPVWTQMAHARLLSPFAEMFATATLDKGLAPRSAQTLRRMVFLSSDYEELAAKLSDDSAEATFLTAIAQGETPTGLPDSLPHAAPIADAFGDAAMPEVLRAQLAEGRLGEVILRAMALFASGADGNPQDLTDGLATLRAVGLEDVARRASLELMILDAERALQ
ncbi:hypothetical protein [Sagittula sp. SSi028]|uniref:hypothetical protein n=1 Tax=Sagittula sp. SSi028 TaxID=3400636 RepID=UPI003AF63132